MRRLLEIKEAAERLNIPEELVADYIAREELHAVELAPGVIRIAPADLERFVWMRRRNFRPLATT